MAIEITKPGLASSIQDAGRPGYYHLGIPLSGALDQYALIMANLLVGNDEGAAVIEATLMAPEMVFDADAVVAVTGAEATPRINGVNTERNTALALRAGDRLGFDFMRLGARLCIAVAGGIDVPLVLGSRSTYALGAIGGLAGRKLQAGDRLSIGTPGAHAKAGRSVPEDLVVAVPKEVVLRVLPGLYDHRLTEASTAAFFSDTWSVAPEADRIGYRYRGGRPLAFIARQPPFGAGSDPSNIVDAGYPYGSIQVPGGLEPIILHRDAVSGGGYAMLGTVISADMDRIAQMQPNNKAHFVKVTMQQALAARAERHARIDRLRSALAG